MFANSRFPLSDIQVKVETVVLRTFMTCSVAGGWTENRMNSACLVDERNTVAVARTTGTKHRSVRPTTAD